MAVCAQAKRREGGRKEGREGGREVGWSRLCSQRLLAGWVDWSVRALVFPPYAVVVRYEGRERYGCQLLLS